MRTIERIRKIKYEMESVTSLHRTALEGKRLTLSIDLYEDESIDEPSLNRISIPSNDTKVFLNFLIESLDDQLTEVTEQAQKEVKELTEAVIGSNLVIEDDGLTIKALLDHKNELLKTKLRDSDVPLGIKLFSMKYDTKEGLREFNGIDIEDMVISSIITTDYKDLWRSALLPRMFDLYHVELSKGATVNSSVIYTVEGDIRLTWGYTNY